MWWTRLRWQLFFPYLTIFLISLLSVTWYASKALRVFYEDQTAASLRRQAILLETHVAPLLSASDLGQVDRLCKDLGEETGTRYTVILPSGVVVGDSYEDPVKMDNHGRRPEIVEALTQGEARSKRHSDTTDVDMMYVAVAHPGLGEPLATIRASIPLTEIEHALSSMYSRVVQAGAAVVLLAALFNLMVSRRISRPLIEMKEGAERFARGDFGFRLPIPTSAEIASLSRSMNQMVGQLKDRIDTVVQQRNELEAVLSSMVEGVFAVDLHSRLISINRAAATLLGVDPKTSLDRPISEIVQNADLLQFVSLTLSSKKPVETNLAFQEEEEKFLQAHGTVLRNADAETIGALVVLNDVTKLQKLENIRRDFVANVSHEIKTPITSITGFVETLLDGALEDSASSRRFLNIIAGQAERLNLLITDLLSLSKVEKEEEAGEISLQMQSLLPVLEAACQACDPQAVEKSIQIDLRCSPAIRANINAPRLEQAVVNLVDNSIKYSDPEKAVRVEAFETNGEVRIEVHDRGCGIPEEALSRLYERFYRVDKARSRKMGGTGLGLAIVKHISLAHKGSVSVESTLGEGSTFSIHLPKA